MTIEVKHLIIKSTVIQDNINDSNELENIDIELLKQQLLTECRELIAESLDEQRDR